MNDASGCDPISVSLFTYYALIAVASFVVAAVSVWTIESTQENLPSNISEAKDTGNKKKPVNLPPWKKLQVDEEHITSGHMPDGPRNPDDKKSVFTGMTVVQVMRAIQEAYAHSSKIATSGNMIKLRGYSSEFNMVIEIWLDIAEKIIKTAYPKG